jgi:uncharacterized protein YnzC (UPF0291/DUF896 family)
VSNDIIIAIVSTIVGFLLSALYQFFSEKRKFKKELESNNRIDLSGNDWYAAWQTSVNGKENLNTEQIVLQQKGGTVRIFNTEKSPENLEGGYLWEGQLQFYFGRDLMGWYFPLKEENNTSKGIMFLHYNSAQKVFVGKWIGSAFDSPLSSGFVIITKERAKSLNKLKKLVKKHISNVNIIEQDVL